MCIPLSHRRSFMLAAALFALTLFVVTRTRAAEPELKSIFPLGCGRGQSIEISLSGDQLADSVSLYFSRSDIRWQHVEKNRFQVWVAEQAPWGECDVWVTTPAGIAGPRRFGVSDLPVTVENGKNEVSDEAQLVALPALLDGRFTATDLDWFSFVGQAGQLITVSCRAKSLDSTARPVITLVGPGGRELAHSRAERLEPRLHCRLAESGSYRLLVRDRSYRSDEASCYRVMISTGPCLLQAVPHVVDRGHQGHVTLLGFDLPGGRTVQHDLRLRGCNEPVQGLRVALNSLLNRSAAAASYLRPAAFMLEAARVRQPRVHGECRLGQSSEPVVPEVEDNAKGAQRVALPCRIAGQFLSRGDVDWFRFAAKKGETLHFEAYGERLDQQMDLELAIHDPAGKQLQVLADFAPPKEVPASVPLASLDPAAAWKVPADGEYELAIRDLYGQSLFGLNRVYELLIERLRPRFRVAVMNPAAEPSRGVTVESGGSTQLQLIALRTGDFAGPIQVRVEGTAAGLEVKACTITSAETIKQLTLKATPNALPGPRPLRLVAEAEIGSDRQAVAVFNLALLRSGVSRLADQTVVHVVPGPAASNQ